MYWLLSLGLLQLVQSTSTIVVRGTHPRWKIDMNNVADLWDGVFVEHEYADIGTVTEGGTVNGSHVVPAQL